jgi:hypothetical protein
MQDLESTFSISIIMGDFKGGVYCTKCTLYTGAYTNFEDTDYQGFR